MIFDLTVVGDNPTTTRFKPRNKASCKGFLIYQGKEIASISLLAMCVSPDISLVGGKFILEWYRNLVPISYITSDLSIQIEYGEGKPAILETSWVIPGIQILEDGVPLAVGSITDIMNKEVTFFAQECQVFKHNYDNTGVHLSDKSSNIR